MPDLASETPAARRTTSVVSLRAQAERLASQIQSTDSIPICLTLTNQDEHVQVLQLANQFLALAPGGFDSIEHLHKLERVLHRLSGFLVDTGGFQTAIHLAVRLARSKLLFHLCRKPMFASLVIPMYNEHHRVLTKEEHPAGEDFVHAKVRELCWLFGPLPAGAPADPSSKVENSIAGETPQGNELNFQMGAQMERPGFPNETVGSDWELVLVDDGCPNSSGALAQQKVLAGLPASLAARVHVIWLDSILKSGNPLFGDMKTTDDSQKGGACHVGMWWALEQQRMRATGTVAHQKPVAVNDQLGDGIQRTHETVDRVAGSHGLPLRPLAKTSKTPPGVFHVVGYTDADLSTHLGQLGLLLYDLCERDVLASMGMRYGTKTALTCDYRGAASMALHDIRALAVRDWARRYLLPPLADVLDTQCGFKMFRASSVRAVLPKLEDRKFSFDMELLIRISEIEEHAGNIPSAPASASLHSPLGV